MTCIRRFLRSNYERSFVMGAASLLLVMTAGCHSAFVQATVQNETGGTVHLLEVDYPNASFGSGELGSGKTFRYRFKILGDGPTKLTWTDEAQKEHSANGPVLVEGEEGTLQITLNKAGTATWSPKLTKR